MNLERIPWNKNINRHGKWNIIVNMDLIKMKMEADGHHIGRYTMISFYHL